MSDKIMTDEQVTNIANKLSEVGRQDLAMKFIHADDKYGILRNEIGPELEANDTKYADKFSNIDDLIGDRNTRLAKLYQSTKGKTPAKARLISFLNNNPDIAEQDVKEWFDKTNEYKDYYQKQREEEAGRTRREQEVKDWDFWKKAITSDYEKQRYIDNPNEALFGGEAPSIGSAPETRWGSIGDLGAGVAAGAADIGTVLIPGPEGVAANLIAGPAIRSGRDIIHKVTDSPYQKSTSEIIGGFGSDVAGNAASYGLANIGKVNKLYANLGGTKKNAYKVFNETRNINTGIDKVLSNADKGLNNTEWNKIIESIPESPLKQDLKAVSNNVVKQGGDMGDEAYNLAREYKLVSNPDIQVLAKTNLETGKPLTNGMSDLVTSPKAFNYLSDVVLSPKPSKVQTAIFKGGDVVQNLNKGNLGTAVFETTPKFKDLRVGEVQRVQTPGEKSQYENDKQNYIQNESRFWRAGFKPREIKGDPLWEAYKEWYKDEYGEEYK